MDGWEGDGQRHHFGLREDRRTTVLTRKGLHLSRNVELILGGKYSGFISSLLYFHSFFMCKIYLSVNVQCDNAAHHVSLYSIKSLNSLVIVRYKSKW